MFVEWDKIEHLARHVYNECRRHPFLKEANIFADVPGYGHLTVTYTPKTRRSGTLTVCDGINTGVITLERT